LTLKVFKLIAALPCLRTASRETQIAKKYGFLTYPQFLDNFYVRYVRFKDVNFRKVFLRHLLKNRDQVEYVVYPDYQYDMSYLLESFNVNWIFPLHRKKEFNFVLKHDFTWVGFPHRNIRFPKSLWGDYTLREYLDFCENHGLRKWYLGFWLESNPHILLRFNGLDTTLPEYYSGKCGKIWLTWNTSVKPRRPMKTIEIFEVNVRNFKKALENLKRTLTFKCLKP